MATCEQETDKDRAKRLSNMLRESIVAKGGGYELACVAALQLHESLLGVKCSCTDSQWDPESIDCPIHGEDNEAECAAQAKSEIDAENAWLRYEENRGYDDGTDGIWR